MSLEFRRFSCLSVAPLLFRTGPEFQVADGSKVDLIGAMSPVVPWNLLGMPAMVVPAVINEDGLPVGIQIVGRPWDEETILDVAVQLEGARGPFPSPPGY